MQAPPEALRAALASRYEVERELGQGGMATVYLARDLKHRRQVAIKIVRPDVAAALGSERFLREIDLAASLTHPHILPLYDSGEAGGFLYYVMPYVEGESLRAKLDREKQLPLEDALRIAREVADALSHAHGRGIVHRDIKPANILLESDHAVVADFGIAHGVSAATGETLTALTATGMTIGTPAYMSPEQAAGSKTLDGRSDLYSLGCVLYEMLAGQPPFTGPTAESLVHQHLSVTPRPITETRPSVPNWVASALQRALAKAPADRFSAALFIAALTRPDTGSLPATPAPVNGPSSVPQPSVPSGSRVRSPWAVAAVTLLAMAALGGAFYVARPLWRPAATPAASAAHQRSAIAVLPFQNLSAERTDAYFAGGLHDELLTQLSKVAALKVISRTSVMGYQTTTKPLRQIADELGVGSIVEGSVQVIGGRLRVNVQLIDAVTDQHLWAERYDRTMDDAFAIQSEVAQMIVASVGAALSSDEQGRLAAAPTANAEAYRLYLQGRGFQRLPGTLAPNLKAAQLAYERALTLDPAFALAHAALSDVHGRMYWFRYDATEARAASQRAEAEEALRLAPELPESHLAMGLAYYWGARDYSRALGQLSIALRGRPGDAGVLSTVGYVQRRLGRWDDVLEAYRTVTLLDPRNADHRWDLGGETLTLLHRYSDGVEAYDRALSLAPDLHVAAVRRGLAYVLWQGRLDPLREVLNRIPAGVDLGSSGTIAAQRAWLLLLDRDAAGLLQMPEIDRPTVFEGQVCYLPSALYAGWAHHLRGEHAAARVAFDAARVDLDSAVKRLPDDWRVHAARGFALAGLGRLDQAVGEAGWLQQSKVYREDAHFGTMAAEASAQILAQAGHADGALDEVERLLAGPSWLSVHTLRLDPRWDPIRNHPRFQALLKKHGS